MYNFKSKNTLFYMFMFLCTLSHKLAGHLDQWNFRTLTPDHSLDCQGGPVWCMASNPVSPINFAVGSDDGMVC